MLSTFIGDAKDKSNELDIDRNERLLKVVQAFEYSLLKVKKELLSKLEELEDIPTDSDDTLNSVEQLRRLRM